MESKDYSRSIEELLSAYQVNETLGLSSKEAQKRLEIYGPNVFTKVKEKSILQEIKETLSEQLMVILLIAAGISLLIKEYHDAIGICFAVLLSITIGILTESRSKKAAEALNRMTEDIVVKVRRDGEKKIIHKSEVIPGDIVCLEAGDQVPADGRIIKSLDLKVREDMLTGESDDVSKREGTVKPETLVVGGKTIYQDPIPAKQFNMLFGGTLVASGRGEILVTTTGDQTEMGHIAKALGTQEVATPLELKMDQLAKTISKLSTAVASILFIYMFAQIVNGCHLHIDHTSMSSFFYSLSPLVKVFPEIKTAFVVCVALIVAAVPEGLPTMINITLAITMKQMAKINVLVRKKEACETIGSVSVICSDKTGTLTENRMTVQKAYLEGHYIHEKQLSQYEHFIRNCLVNSTAELKREHEDIKCIGSATECALLLLCQGFNPQNFRSENEILGQIPFSSQNKYMLTAARNSSEMYMYSKGAPEVILTQCTYEKIDGKIQKLTPARLSELVREINALQAQSMRVLGFAHKCISQRDIEKDQSYWAGEMTFDGFVGICDPLRKGVKESIEIAANAGIETKMLTGDNLQTAVAIGKEIGLVGHGKKAVEASYIDTLSDQALQKEINQIAIVARSKPDTKMRIVSALQKNGEVVAVTGDGINDAPALNKADVGIAMGIAGTEVSKNAADIILTDDSFSTIVEAIKWGRGIYNNFQRFIQFQLTVNIIAFMIAIISQVLDYEMPFTTIHLLWINIIMDGPPALALGLEPIRATVMKRKPIRKDAPINNRYMVRTILINSTFITMLLFIQIKWNILEASQKTLGHASEVQTVLFSLFAFSVLFNALNCREFGTGSIFPNLMKNKLALEIILLTAFLQIIMTEYMGSFFNAISLSKEMWLKIIACGSLVVLLNELIKEGLRLLKYSARTATHKVRSVRQVVGKE